MGKSFFWKKQMLLMHFTHVMLKKKRRSLFTQPIIIWPMILSMMYSKSQPCREHQHISSLHKSTCKHQRTPPLFLECDSASTSVSKLPKTRELHLGRKIPFNVGSKLKGGVASLNISHWNYFFSFVVGERDKGFGIWAKWNNENRG